MEQLSKEVFDPMNKLNAMATFVQIVDKGSLTAAADAMDTSLPTVVRTLASLEACLDVRPLKSNNPEDNPHG